MIPNSLYRSNFSICSAEARVSTFRDLGVTFDPNLKFDRHVDAIVLKAFKMLGFLIRTSRYFQDLHTIILLYKSLVRSQVEYASPVWNPYQASLVNKVEKVQRRFTRFIFRKFNIPYALYEMRCKILDLDSLALRRDVADGVMLYKLYNGIVDCRLTHDICVRRTVCGIANMRFFALKKYTLNAAYYSPLPRMMRVFNEYVNNKDALLQPLHAFKDLWRRSIPIRTFT